MGKGKQYDKQLIIRITNEQHRDFHKWCLDRDTTMTTYLREYIKECIRKDYAEK